VTWSLTAGTDGTWSLQYRVGPNAFDSLRSVLLRVTIEPAAESDGAGGLITLDDETGTQLSLVEGDDGSLYVEVPVQTFEEDYNDDEGMRAAALALVVLGAAFMPAYAFMVWWYSETSVIKMSQGRFLYPILLGGFLLMCSMIPLYFPPSQASCTSASWLFHIGFTLMFASLFAKIWRVAKVVNNPGLRKMAITNATLTLWIASFTAITALYLLLWSVLGTPRAREVETSSSTKADGTREKEVATVCFSPPVWNAVIYALEMAGLLFGVSLAYRARNVHQTFAETRHFLYALLNMFMVGAIILAIVVGINLYETQPDLAYLLTSFGIFLAFAGGISIIFVPKILAVWRHEEVTLNDVLVRPNVPKESLRGPGAGGARPSSPAHAHRTPASPRAAGPAPPSPQPASGGVVGSSGSGSDKGGHDHGSAVAMRTLAARGEVAINQHVPFSERTSYSKQQRQSANAAPPTAVDSVEGAL